MPYKFYLVEKKSPLAWVYLNRPEKKNAMNAPAWKETIPIFKDLDEDPQIRAVIIAAQGETFSSGIDLVGMMPELPELLEKEQKGGIKLKLLKKIWALQDGLTCIENCRKPVIAAVQGHCIGGGLDLIAACDLRICSAEAIFSLREAAVGFVADLGSLQRLPHIIGQGNTKELAYTAKNIDAKRAKSIGLVNEIYGNKERLLKEAEKMALEIAANSPLAVQASKEVLNYNIGRTVEESLKYVASLSTNIIPSKDLFEAVTAFSEKRKPNFKGE